MNKVQISKVLQKKGTPTADVRREDMHNTVDDDSTYDADLEKLRLEVYGRST